MQPPVTAALVLAAGRCRRFGEAKLAASFRGSPLIAHVLEAVRAAMVEGTVICGVLVHKADDEAMVRLARDAGLDPVPNPRPAGGMASSIRLGLEALAARPEPPRLQGTLILLGDQPEVRVETMAALVRAAGHTMDLVRPLYEDEPAVPGHPVFIHRRLWDRARALRGDQGFHLLTAWGGIRSGTIPVPGRNPDVDTPEDLAALELATRHA